MASQYDNYINDALHVFKPPEKLTVSEWADKYRVLSEKDSAIAGNWKTARTPYLKTIMDSFNNPSICDITFCAGTQIGKTAMEQNMIGFAVDQDPGPMLIVYPTDTLAEFTSENRLKPMFQLSPVLQKKFKENESQRLELQFNNMYIALAGANAPSKLSSRPVRYVFFDEIDKFPKWSGNEASPIALASERTKTFWNKKIVKVSTPTLERGNIWRSWLHADAKYKYYVPCPHCGEFQTMEFKNIKWSQNSTIQEIRYAAYYECPKCHGRIDDRHKIAMIRSGQWKRINDTKGRTRSVGYHLNSIYSPWVTFGEIAAEFLSSKDIPENLMNFINSWLAEPWKDKADSMRSDIVMEKQLSYNRGIIPEDAQIITMGVDVQLDHFWWGIRAWGPKMTSWLIDYGRVETYGDIEKLLTRDWPDKNGEARIINLCCMDSGFRADEVYYFCAQHSGVVLPTKGSSHPLTTHYNISRLDKGPASSAFGSLNLYIFDTDKMKDFIAGRLTIKAGNPGSWNVYHDIDRRYCNMVCSEEKVQHQDKKGHITFSWQPIASHAQNHMLDVETNNALAADIMGVRFLQEPQQNVERQQSMEDDDDYLGNTDDYLGDTDNWLGR